MSTQQTQKIGLLSTQLYASVRGFDVKGALLYIELLLLFTL